MRRINDARFLPGDGKNPRTPPQTCLIGLLLIGGLVAPIYAGAADFVYSRSADRSNALPLGGTTLNGLIYVSLSGAPGSGAVDFFVDDPTQSTPPAHSDNSKPFDLVGGTKQSAEAWDLSTLSPGPHTVTAVIRTKRRSDTVHASFNVPAPEAANLPPAIQSVPQQFAAEGETLSFMVVASDPDSASPSLEASQLPPGATFSPGIDGTGEFTWTPDYLAAGAYTVSFTATDADDATLVDSVNVNIAVTDTNRPPSLAPINPQSVEAGQTLSVNVSATDPDGTPPALSIQGLPTGALFTDNGNGIGTLLWDTSATNVGEHSLGVAARDAIDSALADSLQLLISVTAAADTPLTPVTVIWDPHPQAVLGYRVFYGPSVDSAIVQISELRIDTGDISADAPAVTYDREIDLGLELGDSACFRVSAFDATIESPLSEAACI